MEWLRRRRTSNPSSFAAVPRSFGSRDGMTQYVQGGAARQTTNDLPDWLSGLFIDVCTMWGVQATWCPS